MKQDGRPSPGKPSSLWLKELKTESGSYREAGKRSRGGRGRAEAQGQRTGEGRDSSRSERVSEGGPPNLQILG